MLRLPFVAAAALLIPICGATAVVMTVAVGERAGAAPLAGVTPRNSAEAAGLARAADVVRFLRSGEDPRQVYPVRPEVISSAVTQATTLEATIWSRQVELVRVIDGLAPFDHDERAALACLAADLDVDDVVEYLAPEGAQHCEPGKALEGVMARNRSS